VANPVFDNSAVFRGPRSAVVRSADGRAVRADRGPGNGPLLGTAGGAFPASTVDTATLEQMYAAPTATARETGRMTYEDVIVRTAGLLAVIVVVGAATWILAPQLFFVGAIVGLVLGLVNAFKRTPSPALITLYAAAQGVFLGGISAFYDAQWNGVVLQAVLATVSVFAVALVAYRSGKVRVTPKFQRAVMIGLGGYVLFSLVNLGLMLFGAGDGQFGPLRSGGWGFVVGLIAVGLAAASLVMDFDSIKRGVEAGAPRNVAWYAAFGLVVTLVWLYLELLRLAAILRGN